LNYSENNTPEIDPKPPLDLQVVQTIVLLNHILLVRDNETGILIPHFFNGKRYVEDRHWDTIRGFIKNELVDLFCFTNNKTLFVDKPEKYSRLSKYDVSTNDLKKYNQSTGFLNTLTRHIIKNVKDFREIVKEESEFDTNPHEINTQNGIYNIESKKLLPHTPTKLIRNIVDANYIEDDFDKESAMSSYKMPDMFKKIIRDALYDKTKDDVENKKIVRSFLEILASFLIGNNKHKLIFILIGKPNTGKSTLLNILRKIFGLYAAVFNNSEIMISPRTNNDIRPGIIALRGKRLMVGNESNKKDKFDVALLKNISGNDELSVRKPHKENMVNFTLNGKIMLATNFCPNFTDLEDKAFLNRLVLIDFNNIPEEIDTELENKLLHPTNKDLIFTYLTNLASVIVYNDSIFIHERFHANKQRILVSQNTSVALFWNEHIRPLEFYNPHAEMFHHPVAVLYSSMYIPFCKKIGVEHLSLEAFGKDFKLIADQFQMVVWKRGESNNYYIGFTVVGENSCSYNLVTNADNYNPVKIFG